MAWAEDGIHGIDGIHGTGTAYGEGRLMGIDYGRRRSGLALSDRHWRVAVPLSTIGSATWPMLYGGVRLATESHDVYGFVLGLPHALDGTETMSCQTIRRWGKKLGVSFHKPVFFCDERFSTQAAKRAIQQRYGHQRYGQQRHRADAIPQHVKGGWKKHRESGVLDAMAATWMLQTFLDSHRHASSRHHAMTDIQGGESRCS